jgi:hypothetical protein
MLVWWLWFISALVFGAAFAGPVAQVRARANRRGPVLVGTLIGSLIFAIIFMGTGTANYSGSYSTASDTLTLQAGFFVIKALVGIFFMLPFAKRGARKGRKESKISPNSSSDSSIQLPPV